MSPPPGPVRMRVTYPPTPEAVSLARRAAVARLRELRVADDVVERVALVVSELTANVIDTGTGQPFTVDLCVERGAGEVRCAVECDGTADDLPPPEAWRTPPPSALRGRGLALVGAVANDVTVHSSGRRLTIEAAVR